MSAWKAKRFWNAAKVVPEAGGFAVQLDGRPVKTPAKQPLLLPTEALARAVAAEWEAQHEQVRPETMPYTRSSNAAIDKVAIQFDEVATLLSAYGDSDLLCYRAAGPAELIARQKTAWDPVLEWSATALSAPLEARTGVIHIAQQTTSTRRLENLVRTMTAFELTAFHDLVGLSGSLVLALAVTHERLSEQDAWDASRLDENWQMEQWGRDDEADREMDIKRSAFFHAASFFRLSR